MGEKASDVSEGGRSGEGSDSILPYLMESLRGKVQAPDADEPSESPVPEE